MKPFIILIIAFCLTLTGTYLSGPVANYTLAGTIAMTTMLLFTAIGHFAFARGMSMMLPEIIPYKKQLVWLTGLIEIAAALGILVPTYRIVTGWLLIVFFILILPANIYAAKKQINYQAANHSGKGLSYLWIRIPLQIFYIFWVYFFIIHLPFK